jgi:hypothetical protein
MKWIMIIALAGIAIALATNENLRSKVMSMGSTSETKSGAASDQPATSGGSRLGEMDAASEMSLGASR